MTAMAEKYRIAKLEAAREKIRAETFKPRQTPPSYDTLSRLFCRI
jgi:hypothetical protein